MELGDLRLSGSLLVGIVVLVCLCVRRGVNQIELRIFGLVVFSQCILAVDIIHPAYVLF